MVVSRVPGTTADERTPEQATVIAHDSSWKRPVIPVVAGITGWSFIHEGAFTRWTVRPGAVVLGVWQHDYSWRDGPERSEDEIVASDPPELEVPLAMEEYADLLRELVMAGKGTLAVLEFGGGADDPPVWGNMEVGTDGLAEAMRMAGDRDVETFQADLTARDFDRKPVTEEELAVWAAMTPEERALFNNRLTLAFRWLLAREEDQFPDWPETAVTLGGVRPTAR